MIPQVLKASEKLKSLSATPTYVKVLIYGDAGVGKTWLACTAPNPLLILSEWAVAKPTLERLRRDRGVDPDTLFVNSWADFEEAYKYAAASVRTNKYDTIVIDGLTDLNDRVMEEVLKDSVGKADASISRAAKHDPDILEIGDWNKVMNRTMYAARLFRDLPCHVVMTALAQEVKKEMVTAPMVAPKGVQKKIPAYFNMVGFLETTQVPGRSSIRKLNVESTGIYVAKNPGGALAGVVENPDMTTIIAQIQEFLTSDTQVKTIVANKLQDLK